MPVNEQLAYPIGRFQYDEQAAVLNHDLLLSNLYKFPAELVRFMEEIDPSLLVSVYRPGGWNGMQVIHHLYDSHTHAYMRFKWALTESNPSILPYDENKFVELPDYRIPVDIAIQGLYAVHAKWYAVMKGMDEADWQKTYFHLGYGQVFSLRYALSMYAWHCKHHFGHIRLCCIP